MTISIPYATLQTITLVSVITPAIHALQADRESSEHALVASGPYNRSLKPEERECAQSLFIRINMPPSEHALVASDPSNRSLKSEERECALS